MLLVSENKSASFSSAAYVPSVGKGLNEGIQRFVSGRHLEWLLVSFVSVLGPAAVWWSVVSSQWRGREGVTCDSGDLVDGGEGEGGSQLLSEVGGNFTNSLIVEV